MTLRFTGPINTRSIDRDGETPIEAAIGAGIGAGFGLVTGLIEGKRGFDLFDNILEDAGFGAMTGLTDGLNLVAKVGINASVSATGEAFKEVISHDRTGCPYDFDPTRIAIAGLAGAAGELGGRAFAVGRSLNYAQATHVIFEESENAPRLLVT